MVITVRAFLACLACACACAAQGGGAPVSSSPPGVVIIKLKRERQSEQELPSYGASRTISEPDAMNDPGGIVTTSRPPFPQRTRGPEVYKFSVEIKNGGAQEIRWLSWEYVVSNSANGKELGRYEFSSHEKISPTKKRTLRGQARLTPAPGAGGVRPGHGERTSYEERVEFRCMAYNDGTWWHHPSVREFDCIEAERRGK